MRKVAEERLLPALDAFRPELIYISAGFDAHRDDDLTNLGWVESDYAWLTARILDVAHRHATGRITLILEGGCALHALVQSVEVHVGVHVGVLLGAVDA